MVAIGNDLDAAGTARQLREGLGRIELARLTLAPNVEHRALHARCELEDVRAVLQRVDEARCARYVPPSGQEQQLASSARGDEIPGLLCDLRKDISSEKPCAACALHHLASAAMRRKQDERPGAGMVRDMTDRERAAVAVSDHDRIGE